MFAAGESGPCIVIATYAGGQRIAALDAQVDALQRAGSWRWARSPTYELSLACYSVDWRCPYSAEGDMRALNEGQGLTPIGLREHSRDLSALVTNRVMETWYHVLHCMNDPQPEGSPWQATSDDENS